MQKFKLIGHPIRHSLSPIIHRLFAAQFGFELDYQLEEVLPSHMANFIEEFYKSGGSGVNVTAPYKETILQQLDALDPAAQVARAVNTVYMTETGQIRGANTDGVGLVRDLARHEIQLKTKRILLIGAGGAARGILQSLIDMQPITITLTNRTQKNAENLLVDFCAPNLDFKPLTGLAEIEADVIIHAISSNLESSLYAQINYANTAAYDLNYTKSTFLNFAVQNGANKIVNGIGMLVEQAAEAFYIWHKLKPNTHKIFENIQY